MYRHWIETCRIEGRRSFETVVWEWRPPGERGAISHLNDKDRWSRTVAEGGDGTLDKVGDSLFDRDNRDVTIGVEWDGSCLLDRDEMGDVKEKVSLLPGAPRPLRLTIPAPTPLSHSERPHYIGG